MSQNIRNLALISVVVFASLVICPTISSANDDTYRRTTAGHKMFHKLGRGITNILTGWIEVPKNIAINIKKYDPFSGFVVGTVEGTAFTFCRTMSGVYDVVTFPFAVPANYAPLMEPEFILPDIWGDPLPFMENVSGLDSLAP